MRIVPVGLDAKLGRFRRVRAVNRFAQFALVAELQQREIRREMQREFKARLAIGFSGCARSLPGIVGQAGEVGFGFDEQRVIIGRIEHVFRKLCRQRRMLFLDFREALLFFVRQFCAAEAEIAQGIVDDFLARRRVSRVFRAVAQQLVFFEQREILRQFSPEFRDLGLVFVIHGAQFRRIDDSIQMANDAPGAAELFGGFFERFDEAGPAHRRGGRRELRDDGAVFFQQRVDGRCNAFRLDRLEARQVGEIEQGIQGECHGFSFFPLLRWYSSAAW